MLAALMVSYFFLNYLQFKAFICNVCGDVTARCSFNGDIGTPVEEKRLTLVLRSHSPFKTHQRLI